MVLGLPILYQGLILTHLFYCLVHRWSQLHVGSQKNHRQSETVFLFGFPLRFPVGCSFERSLWILFLVSPFGFPLWISFWLSLWVSFRFFASGVPWSFPCEFPIGLPHGFFLDSGFLGSLLDFRLGFAFGCRFGFRFWVPMVPLGIFLWVSLWVPSLFPFGWCIGFPRGCRCRCKHFGGIGIRHSAFGLTATAIGTGPGQQHITLASICLRIFFRCWL